MNRATFLKALAALPFVGRLVKPVEVVTLENDVFPDGQHFETHWHVEQTFEGVGAMDDDSAPDPFFIEGLQPNTRYYLHYIERHGTARRMIVHPDGTKVYQVWRGEWVTVGAHEWEITTP